MRPDESAQSSLFKAAKGLASQVRRHFLAAAAAL